MRKETDKGLTLMRSGRKSILSWTRPSLSQTGASHSLKLKGLNGGYTSLFLVPRSKGSVKSYIYIYTHSLYPCAISLSRSLLSQSLLCVRRIILYSSALYLSSIRVFCRYVGLACSRSLFLLAPALLEEGFVEMSGGRWVRQ